MQAEVCNNALPNRATMQPMQMQQAFVSQVFQAIGMDGFGPIAGQVMMMGQGFQQFHNGPQVQPMHGDIQVQYLPSRNERVSHRAGPISAFANSLCR